MELTHIVVLLAAAAGALGSCTRVESASPAPVVSLVDGGAAGESAGGAGSRARDGGAAGEHEYVGAAGAPPTVELGVWPTFSADPNQPRDVQAVLAAVSTLSLGASTLPIAERWDQLSGATGSPRASTWSRVDAMSKPFRDRGAGLALCIDIVDRGTPAWPFTGELDTDAASAAIERTIDEVFARYAARLSHLCFGYELDRYLASASKAAQARLLAFLEHAVDYAQRHPLRTATTAIGTAISLQALTETSRTKLRDIVLGDEAVAVYDPLDDAGHLKEPEAIVAELTVALDTLAALARPKLPLTLFEVGYPSASDLESSEARQRTFYDAFFGLLDSRRGDFGFVGVYGLADRAAADCEAEVSAFLGTSSPDLTAAWASARCSMGLRAGGGGEVGGEVGEVTDKLAWPELSAALSRFR